MKKIYLILSMAFAFSACDKLEFEEAYSDPSKISTTTIDKQFAGFLSENIGYVFPTYWNYFVVLTPTVIHYTQAGGWINGPGQYVPGGGLISDRWNNFYGFLAQYRGLENVYNSLSDADKADKRIFMIAATIYLYDHSQKVIDLHGDIPFLEAGKLSTNGGNYSSSYPAYDNAATLYTKMLDDLKGFATELNAISVSVGAQTLFNNQDFVNEGDIDAWKRYCNSLRLRLLMRVSGTSALASRASTEIAEILGAPATYPIVADNVDNIQVEVKSLVYGEGRRLNAGEPGNSGGFQGGIESEGWNKNLAGKAMIDHMKAAGDPRLPLFFEENADGEFVGLDPLELAADQDNLVRDGLVSIYNRSTFSRNVYFPGMLINSAELYFHIAEYQLKAGNDGAAKTAYQKGIEQSIKQYFEIRSWSLNTMSPAVTDPSDADIATYQGSASVSWDAAADTNAKLGLIATQKWLHYNIIQPLESWAEVRRLDAPNFSFQMDNTQAQSQPPVRWIYPSSEQTYNTANYDAVRASDNLTTKLFWDN